MLLPVLSAEPQFFLYYGRQRTGVRAAGIQESGFAAVSSRGAGSRADAIPGVKVGSGHAFKGGRWRKHEANFLRVGADPRVGAGLRVDTGRRRFGDLSCIRPVRPLRRVVAALPRGPARAHPGAGHGGVPGHSHQRGRPAARPELEPVPADGARAPVQAASLRLRPPRSRPHAHLEPVRLRQPAIDRDPHAAEVAGPGAHHLDGRPAASAGVRGPYLAGVLHGAVGRRDADGDDHPPQAGMVPPQRSGAQRTGPTSPNISSATTTT